MQKQRLKQGGALILLVIISIVLPFIASTYWTDVATNALFYAMLALGLNVVVGYTGLLDLGYAAFFAVGAYTTGILTTHYHVNFWLTIICAAILAGISGVIIGAPTLRLRSDYLAIVTLGFGEIVQETAQNLQFTGGDSGIYGIPKPSIGSYVLFGESDMYFLMLIFTALTVFVVYRLSKSRVGRAWKYIREDEDAAEAMGINRVRYKILAYVFGAVVGGVGGSLFAVKMSAISPASVGYSTSIMILLAVVIGGLGRIPGVVLGGILVVVLPEAMRSFSSARLLVFGVLLVAIMIFRPEGIWAPRKRTKRKVAEGGTKHVAG